MPNSPLTWRQLESADRREVLRLADRGERHPDPIIAEAAYRWANAPGWSRRVNRAPGWLLPAVGAVALVTVVVLKMPVVFAIAAAIAVVCGLLGWFGSRVAAKVRSVGAPEFAVPAPNDIAP